MKLRDVKTQLHEWIESGDTKLLKILYSTSKIYLSDNAELATEENQSNQLYRMVYTSARRESCDQAAIDQILADSQKNNVELELTGLLIYTEDRFMQILEGPLGNIMQLYNKINKDERHGGTRIRYCEPASERYFSNWHMAGKDVSKAALDMHTALDEKELKLYESMMDGDLSSYEDEGMKVLKTFLAIS